jgi:hypothetical protein
MDEKLYALNGIYIDGGDYYDAPFNAEELGSVITEIAAGGEIDPTSLVISNYENE